MKLVLVIVGLLVFTACKSTATHKCDAYESRPVTKKK